MSKVILISGATSGMGKASAFLLASKGHQVFAGARNQTKANQLKDEAQAQNIALKTVILDVQDEQSVNSAVKQVQAISGRLDVLVNNAGYGLVATVEDGSDEEIQQQFDVNVFGVFRLCRAALPIMRQQGHGIIINVSSFLGRMGLPLLSHYNASKYAVEGLTDSLRYEVAPLGIRVNSILPGLFRTDFVNRGLVANEKTTAEDSPYLELVSHMVPMVASKINEGPDPIAVAEAVYSVMEDDKAPIRTPVGEEAELFIPMADELNDEEFEEKIKDIFSL